MYITKIVLAASVYIFLVNSHLAWAIVKKGPSNGTSYLFIIIAVIGGIIALLGIILAFRGVTSPAEVSIKIPNIGAFKFNKVSQGVVLAIIGAIILVSVLYLYPTTTTKTITETTTTEGEDGTRIIHRETMAK